MTRASEPYKTVNFFDWTGGINNRLKNPLAYPPNCLMAGENVELVEGGLKSRGGTSITSAGSLPVGEVRTLKQVRFPTNEVSYLVAQAYAIGGIGVDSKYLKIYGHATAANQTTGKVYSFGGQVYEAGVLNILLETDPTTGVWTHIQPLEAEGLPPQPYARLGALAVWDSVNGRLIVHGGGSGSGGLFNDVWAYDPRDNQWVRLWASYVAGSPYRQWHAGFYYDGALWICGGIELTPPATHSVTTFERFDLSTLTWSTVVCELTGVAPQDATWDQANLAYHKVVQRNGIAYSYGGRVFAGGSEHYSNCIIVCDLAARTATWGGIINQEGIACHAMDIMDDMVVISGGYGPTGETFADTFLAGTVGLAPSHLALTGLGDAAPRMQHTLTASGERLVIVGGRSPSTPNDPATFPEGEYWAIESSTWETAEFHPELLTGGYKLFACPELLPTTSGTFSEIYDLGNDAGVCSFAVLNDRVVITEGASRPPLVWGGSMTDDGSDWMYPKAVLVSQDGVNFYDISAQVLDKDPDNTAAIGNIRSTGYIAVCCDMPQVKGFYFEMGTPNSVSMESMSRTWTDTVDFPDSDAFEQLDLKGAISRWVQDDGVTGHFEDSSNNPLSLGPGKDCPEIETGLVVAMGSTQRTIVSLSGDGSGIGAVSLSSVHAGSTVHHIYGLSVSSSNLSVNEVYSADTAIFSVIPDRSVRYGGYSIRQVVPGSAISAAANSVKVTIKAGSGFTWPAESNAFYEIKMGGSLRLATSLLYPLMITGVSIVERDGETANGATAPTALYFPGQGQIYSVGNDYVSIAAATSTPGAELTTMSKQFAIDETKDYLVIMDIADIWYKPRPVAGEQRPYERCGNLAMSGGAGFYYKTDPQAAAQTYLQQTVEDFEFQEGYCLGLMGLLANAQEPLPTQLLVAHTTDASRFDLSKCDGFQSVTVTQSVPGDSALYHAVSLDGRSTFQVFKNGAWRTIVRESGEVWQYLDGTDAWENSSTDSLLVALREAFAIPANQMTGQDLGAITSDQWLSAGGIVIRITAAMDFAMGFVAASPHVPYVTKYTITYNDTGETTIHGWKNGGWTSGSGWTDNTRNDNVPWGQNGTISYAGETFTADYHVLNEVPGYWFRFMSNGTSEGTTITRIRYKAPCQPLSNIGDGQPDTPLGFIFHDVSADSIQDYTVEVSDNAETELSVAPIPMATNDYLYVGYLTPFNEIEITPYTTNNQQPATVSAEYWNGEAWTSVVITDGTASTSGKTFSLKGKVSWTLPTDWKTVIPFDSRISRGYWIRFKVSSPLSSTTAIAEVRIYATPMPLVKHRLAVTVRDRVVLLSRPDAWDQCDVSRALEEYGFSGEDSGSYRVGGMDSIQCAVAAWNGLLVGKTETWHQLVGSAPNTFSFEGVEAARHIPVNSSVIVKAPMAGMDAGTRYGLFFINRFGAFVSTGLQTDSTWNTGRGMGLSDSVDWWNEQTLPHLSLRSLYRACGEYWPLKNWIVWAVPMVTEAGRTQTTNNRLIIYDLSLRTWLPPFTISLASLTAAYHYSDAAPGRLGEMGLYGGDYQGRIIRLFGPSDTTDLGQPIPGWIETGWLSLGSPEWLKLIRRFQVYGQTSPGSELTAMIWADGTTAPSAPNHTLQVSDLDSLHSRFFGREETTLNVQGRFFKFRIQFQDVTQIFGMQIGTSLIREWGAG